MSIISDCKVKKKHSNKRIYKKIILFLQYEMN